MLVLGYGFFTLAAGARSAVQLAGHPGDALLAYLLSAVAAAIYACGTVLVARADRGRGHGAARVLCLVEVAGVVGVGLLSVLRPDLFPRTSVWSGFGSGYGYVPAALPVLALVWLHRARAPEPAVTSRGEGGSGGGGTTSWPVRAAPPAPGPARPGRSLRPR